MAVLAVISFSWAASSALAARSAGPDPCNLLTQAEASSALGSTVTTTVPGQDETLEIGLKCFYYVSRNDSRAGYVQVLEAAGASPVFDECETTADFVRTVLSPTEKEAGFQQVSGLGQVAAVDVNLAEIDLCDRRTFVSIVLVRDGSPAATSRAVLEHLASDALPRVV